MKTLSRAALLAAALTASGAQAQDTTVAAGSIATPTQVSSAAVAQASSLTPSAAPDGCELHIWPAERMSSSTVGLLGAGLLNSAINANRDSSNQSLMATALDSTSQLDALVSLDLRTLLPLTPGTTFVRHEQPLERKTMNKVKTRRSDSTATCYSELIVADVQYMKSPIYGRSLRTLFMFRKFDAGQTIAWEYKAWGGNGLSLFPPKEGEDAIAALNELSSVYQKNFDEYATNARKSAPKPAA